LQITRKGHQTVVLIRDSVNPERALRLINSLNRYEDDVNPDQTTIKADVFTVVGDQLVDGLFLPDEPNEEVVSDTELREAAESAGYALRIIVS